MTRMPLLYDMGHRNECCVTNIMLVQKFLALTSKCDHDLGAITRGATHCLMMGNISAKSFENPPRKGKVMDRTRKKTLSFVLGFNDTSALVVHFVSSPREREKRYRRDSR